MRAIIYEINGRILVQNDSRRTRENRGNFLEGDESFRRDKMNKILVVFAMVLVFCCSGCNEQTKQVSRETASMAVKFNELVKAGKTTREQEKAYIDSVAKVCFQLDRAIRGTKASEITQRNAVIEAQTGINPNAPLILDDVPVEKAIKEQKR
jgi:outer membrane murein-binding lipoprotein Lpp